MFALVSHQFEFLIGRSAKLGCPSFKRWYLDTHAISPGEVGRPICEPIGYGDTKLTRVNGSNPDQYHDYGKFAVVRNPFSRFVSGFLNKYVLNKQMPNRGWSSFLKLLRNLETNKKFALVDRHHFTPQFSEAYSHFEKAAFQFDIGIALERLKIGLSEVSQIVGAPQRVIQAANRSEYTHDLSPGCGACAAPISELENMHAPSFVLFHNPEAISLVQKIYAIDFSYSYRLKVRYDALADPLRK